MSKSSRPTHSPSLLPQLIGRGALMLLLAAPGLNCAHTPTARERRTIAAALKQPPKPAPKKEVAAPEPRRTPTPTPPPPTPAKPEAAAPAKPTPPPAPSLPAAPIVVQPKSHEDGSVELGELGTAGTLPDETGREREAVIKAPELNDPAVTTTLFWETATASVAEAHNDWIRIAERQATLPRKKSCPSEVKRAKETFAQNATGIINRLFEADYNQDTVYLPVDSKEAVSSVRSLVMNMTIAIRDAVFGSNRQKREGNGQSMSKLAAEYWLEANLLQQGKVSVERGSNNTLILRLGLRRNELKEIIKKYLLVNENEHCRAYQSNPEE